MFEVGMGIIRKYRTDVAILGEIISIHEDADGETLVTVMYDDGAVKTYVENVLIDNPRMIVTEEVIW